MLKKNLRRLVVGMCIAGAFATAAPAYADGGSSGQAVIAMNGGGGPG